MITRYVCFTDGTELTLQNSGNLLCAIPYQTGFVTIGGCCSHGKVDRCSNHHCHHHHPLSVRGMTLLANTWIPFPTWPHLDMTTAAQPLTPTASRWKCPQDMTCPIIFLLYFKQVLLVAGGINSGWLASTETFSNGRWTPGGNLPRWKYLSNHLN